jgi:hypothetical protein
MRTLWGFTLVGLLTAAAARADDRGAARAVIDRAVNAQGGADALLRAQVVSRTTAGFVMQGGKPVPFTSTTLLSLPDRMRLALTLDKKVRIVTILNGDKGWQLPPGGSVTELTPEHLREIREEAYVWWLTTLVPLRKGPFTLTPLPDVKINGEPAAGVKVASPGHGDVRLYFDKGTGLLARIERRASEFGVQVDKEYHYTDYKTFDGVKLPTKEAITLSGKKWSEAVTDSCKFLAHIDEKEFSRP